MTARASTYDRRFMRNADKALLAGVCAGIADYFGFNLRVTRLLVIIAFFVAMPFTLLTYFAIVFLVPAHSERRRYESESEYCRLRRRVSRKERKRREEEQRQEAADAFSRRYRRLDDRLAQLEKYVTSSRFELERELSRL